MSERCQRVSRYGVKGESFAVGHSRASVGVIAGLISGALEGRLKIDDVDESTPPRNIYLALKENGKLKIIGPGGKMVEELFKEAKVENSGTFFHRERTSHKFFTTNTLAEHLNWTVGGSKAKDGLQPSRRFYAAFDVLTLILSARGRDDFGRETRPKKSIEPLRAWA